MTDERQQSNNERLNRQSAASASAIIVNPGTDGAAEESASPHTENTGTSIVQESILPEPPTSPSDVTIKENTTTESETPEKSEANGEVRADSSASTAASVATPSETESGTSGPEGEAKSETQPTTEAKPKTVTAPTTKPTPTTEKANAPAVAAEKPKKAAPPPDPRLEAAKEVAELLSATIKKSLGENRVEEVGAAHITPMIRIEKSNWREAVEHLRDNPEWKLNYVECMAATDYPDYIEIVLYIQSTSLGHFVCLKTRTERTKAEVPSLAQVYPAVNWEEREIYDLLGVKFTNHPDLRRIMMWDEFKGHPLRKDYSEWDSEEEEADGTD